MDQKKGVLFLLGLCTFLSSLCAVAGIPVWTLEPLTPTQLTLTPSTNGQVNYQVTNQSHKIHQLKMRFIDGVTASGCEEPIAYKQSCVLNLTINGSLLKRDIKGGPVLCEQGNLNQCYQPSEGNGLNISLAQAPQAVLELSATSISFIVGHLSSALAVTNSSSISAINLQLNNLPNTLQVDASSTCVLGSTLAAGQSCTFIFTASAPISTSISVSSNNSNSVPITINATAPNPPILSVISPSAVSILEVDGTTALTFTVQNTGSSPATNITLSSLNINGIPWTDVDFINSTCNTLNVGDTCAFGIQTTTPNLVGQIVVSSSNAASVNTPFVAFRYEGGLVFSRELGPSPGEFLIKIVTETETVPLGTTWGSNTVDVTGANDLYNGLTNTAAIVAEYPTNSYAGNICNTYEPNIDWYLPAICELGPYNPDLGLNAGCNNGTPSVASNLYFYGFLSNLLTNRSYWSSTQVAGQATPQAWTLNFEDFDGFKSRQDPQSKTNINFVGRCVRQISLLP